MSGITWIGLGGVAGFVASGFVDGTGDQRFTNRIRGVLGAAVGGTFFEFVGQRGVSGWNLWSIVVSVIGLVLALSVCDRLVRPRLH